MDNKTVTRQSTGGVLVIAMMSALESAGIQAVYLRNYEKLPEEVGNDVDVLVGKGSRLRAISVLREEAKKQGWAFLGKTHFSPIAVYFANPETAQTLHIDIFVRLEWHFIEFAAAAEVIAKRRFNGLVHIPAAEDEIYLNLATRLIYQGKIREKHQLQASNYIQQYGEVALIRTFGEHLGKPGESLARDLVSHQWQASPGIRKALLSAALLTHGIHSLSQLVNGMLRYGWRILRKLVKPPGHFIVLEGADGVGKSTILEAILPWCSEWCAGRDTYDFHWKPVRLYCGPKKSAPSVNPRVAAPRSAPASLIYLLFHVFGFWWGWLFNIRPLLSKSHCVVGDRYSYDLFLDPRRFRLKLPDGLCKLASLLAPKPDVTVALLAVPKTVHARKPELTVTEILNYQERWSSLSSGRSRMITISADGTPEEVILRVKQAILKIIGNHEV
jgi:thymidylate kinase